MIDQYIPLGSRVFISDESEHYPGQLVWVIDSMPEDEYSYCVSPNRTSTVTTNCEWVLGKHVSIPGENKLPDSKPLEIGDRVVARDDSDFTIRPELGYIAEMDDTMIGITYAKGGEAEILVRRRFVKHV